MLPSNQECCDKAPIYGGKKAYWRNGQPGEIQRKKTPVTAWQPGFNLTKAYSIKSLEAIGCIDSVSTECRRVIKRSAKLGCWNNFLQVLLFGDVAAPRGYAPILCL